MAQKRLACLAFVRFAAHGFLQQHYLSAHTSFHFAPDRVDRVIFRCSTMYIVVRSGDF